MFCLTGSIYQLNSSSSVSVAFRLLFHPDAGWGTEGSRGFGDGNVFGNSQANNAMASSKWT